MKGVFTGDLGPSLVLRNRTVNDIVKEQFPRSIKLGLLALLLGASSGSRAGILSALKPNSIFDYAAKFFSNVGAPVPNFLVGTLLIYFVALKVGWT